MPKDWTKHGLTNPPDAANRTTQWLQDVLWVSLEKLTAVQDRGCSRFQEHQNMMKVLGNGKKARFAERTAGFWDSYGAAIKILTTISLTLYACVEIVRTLVQLIPKGAT